MTKKIKLKKLFLNPDNLNAAIKNMHPSAPNVVKMEYRPDEGWQIEFDADNVSTAVKDLLETLLKQGLYEITEEKVTI